VTEPAGDQPADEAAPAGETPAEETAEEKRARVMRRLAEMIRADPPDLSGSGGPVSVGGFPMLPSTADEFDQESAAELFAALGDFFKRHRKPGGEEGPEGVERE
jgi:hypothetical protein